MTLEANTVLVVDDEILSLYRDKEFAHDWTSPNFRFWIKLFAPFTDQPVKILEIGSCSGRSTTFLRFLRRCLLSVDA
jgi:hypothetical protein